MSEKMDCPPRATFCWEYSKISIWAIWCRSLSDIPTRNGAKNVFTASQPIAPAKCPCSAAENFTMCASRVSGCFAGLALLRELGRVSPNFLMYSTDWPEQ
jgi:hypothetical protein